MKDSKVESLVKRLCNAVLKNYDEILSELEDSAVSLDLSDMGFELPSDDYPDNYFVDELFGYIADIENGYLDLCISRVYGDGCERVDEVDVSDLGIDYLERLVSYAEGHKCVNC